MDYSEYSEDDFKKTFTKIYRALTFDMSPVNTPTAYILGGQSGAGKTNIHHIIQMQNPNIIVIDGDRFREYHPNFAIIHRLYKTEASNFTQSFSNNLVNKLIDCLSSEKYNLIIEGTCRTIDVPLKTCCALKGKGYRVELAVMCTDKNISWQSTIDRYNEMKAHGLVPRAVPKDKYIEMVKAIPHNVSQLYKLNIFDEIVLYNRNRDCIYKLTENPNINPGKIVFNAINELSLLFSDIDLENDVNTSQNDISLQHNPGKGKKKKGNLGFYR